MAAYGPATDGTASEIGGYRLRFLNDEWNDSISNGEPFTLRWNSSLTKDESTLELFKVTYPKEGIVLYELVSDLTGACLVCSVTSTDLPADGDVDSMSSASCVWTPDGLEPELYTVWLSHGQDAHANWTMSPPWMPTNSSGIEDGKRKTSRHRLHWAAPIIIPVVCLLVLYAICLTTCFVYRRRKKATRERDEATAHREAGRNNSVDSATTVLTFTESNAEEDKTKSGSESWIFHNSSAYESKVTVGGVPETDITEVKVGERMRHNDGAIGIGL
ncbi:hypothetical protein DCS_02083 [Drechmeria coniospora]|uniref:Uncharacterized protein n=1 Tax=Drechmeria coniospora TaxID=98403 RepID=A0A151GV51_DRECN|nr:hypothetical protein DCS_02083 [Drechmeria coniospora]KYK60943.1 hypothetical protein DCS_02083 [Drechmeria coniospora]